MSRLTEQDDGFGDGGIFADVSVRFDRGVWHKPGYQVTAENAASPLTKAPDVKAWADWAARQLAADEDDAEQITGFWGSTDVPMGMFSDPEVLRLVLASVEQFLAEQARSRKRGIIADFMFWVWREPSPFSLCLRVGGACITRPYIQLDAGSVAECLEAEEEPTRIRTESEVLSPPNVRDATTKCPLDESTTVP